LDRSSGCSFVMAVLRLRLPALARLDLGKA
jgi:hypothetical protein